MTLLLTAALITVVIAIHEAGHLVVAKWCRMKVDAFSIGIGPKLLSVTRNGTEYSFGPILIGGYVAIDEDEQALHPPMQRLWVALAGPAANFITVALPCLVAAVAAKGLRVGCESFVRWGGEVVKVTIGTIAGFFTGATPISELSGPVGVFTMTESMVDKHGINGAIAIYVGLSLSVGVLNLVPLPPLDGYQAARSLWEAIRGRPMPHIVHHVAMVIGMLFLLALCVFVMIKDIRQLFA